MTSGSSIEPEFSAAVRHEVVPTAQSTSTTWLRVRQIRWWWLLSIRFRRCTTPLRPSLTGASSGSSSPWGRRRATRTEIAPISDRTTTAIFAAALCGRSNTARVRSAVTCTPWRRSRAALSTDAPTVIGPTLATDTQTSPATASTSPSFDRLWVHSHLACRRGDGPRPDRPQAMPTMGTGQMYELRSNCRAVSVAYGLGRNSELLRPAQVPELATLQTWTVRP
jgi:hypothetical protein